MTAGFKLASDGYFVKSDDCIENRSTPVAPGLLVQSDVDSVRIDSMRIV